MCVCVCVCKYVREVSRSEREMRDVNSVESITDISGKINQNVSLAETFFSKNTQDILGMRFEQFSNS